MRRFGGIMVTGLVLCGFGGVGHAAQLPLYGGLARCTGRVVVPPGGTVYCVAMAESPEPIYTLMARIMENKNKAVEQFGYSFGAAPGVVSVGYYAEEATNSFSPRSRYCQIVVGPASATLKATFLVRLNGEVVFEQHESDLGRCPGDGRNDDRPKHENDLGPYPGNNGRNDDRPKHENDLGPYPGNNGRNDDRS